MRMDEVTGGKVGGRGLEAVGEVCRGIEQLSVVKEQRWGSGWGGVLLISTLSLCCTFVAFLMLFMGTGIILV